LPPLYHEALTADLKDQLVTRIRQCIPFYEGTQARANWKGRVEVVELPRTPPPPQPKPRVFAFSVDTGVEQHGPHLPLATDTIQSYAVLEKLATEFDGFVVGPPVDYGQLTWGLPFGFSIDVTAPLITRYVTGFANAIVDWLAPAALYVVDVHGSVIHQNAIRAGLKASRCPRHAFRWLHDSLTTFSADRADMHAGGVETILVETISRDLLDARWWPGRSQELAAHQMPVPTAVELSSDLTKFIRHVESGSLNGIIGRLENYTALDGAALLERMREVARVDVRQLLDRSA
jgi:creatinine amidohydrolase